MKKLILLLVGMSTGRIMAAAVAWGILSMNDATTTNSGRLGPMGGSPIAVASGEHVYPNAVISLAISGNNTATITADPNDIVTAYGDSWVLVEEGELVDASTTRNLDAYFLHGWIDGQEDDWDLRADAPIVLPARRSDRFYLGFASASSAAEKAYPQYDWSDVYYGWALFEYSYGRLTLVDSALNIEGGGIYAGTSITVPIPEPSSCALAVLGVVALLRRRLAIENRTERKS